ncbi:PTS glucitol/sorbitol transporter subunit IIA [Loigolactobacillus backii]|uniref:PTS glucitol/sorbitol transporter subunit IIA n=1 Tax=Loigolactobacillus backii TaxID=375175 RepID=UPI0007F08BC4|nr:PTS glucitol/sorbitol transporter subunit IIA [Loigolactobacillus backii]ANK60537.1 PTS sorbitol transporter subunit IIA [Loigolactobacillus backii]ANK65488.1 PTS sorbitol transporter subunit IIA [Loigolactobacillus backii]ANK67962.1 PTS sorbitol transporter subunit IIA [Loigolactobacillus backii]MDA5387902.1 PTS glucitol/sorbitol transporter subunit IIA [Loigolactobacillus backii]MDA5390394.1 PTS glucitol/sorbitol transporter subunit IIA [Loigolactobacillus backii]
MESVKTTIFETTVTEIGAEAKGFKEINMVIFFGKEAPDALRSSCYLIDVMPVKATPKPGMTLLIDDQAYTITAVGNEVMTNLSNLGHISIVFDGSTKPELAGTMYVEQKAYPEINEGSSIQILK